MSEDQSERVPQDLDQARYKLARFIGDDVGDARKSFIGDMVRFYECLIKVETIQPKGDSPGDLTEAQSLKKAANGTLMRVQDTIQDKRKRLDGYEQIYSEGSAVIKQIETAWRNQPNINDLQVTMNTLQDMKDIKEGKI